MGEITELIEQQFQEFCRHYPQTYAKNEQGIKDIADAIGFELSDRELKLMWALEEQFQARLKNFKFHFLHQEIQISDTYALTVENVIQTQKVQDDWDKIQAAIEADPATKKQWEGFLLLLRLGK